MVSLISQFVPSLKKRIKSDRDALPASGGRVLWLGLCPTADRVISGNWELSITWGGKMSWLEERPSQTFNNSKGCETGSGRQYWQSVRYLRKESIKR